MTFAGMPRGKERADVIAFLNTKSDKPVELPKQAAAPAAEKQASPADARRSRRRLRSAEAALTTAVLQRRTRHWPCAGHAELMSRHGPMPCIEKPT